MKIKKLSNKEQSKVSLNFNIKDIAAGIPVFSVFWLIFFLLGTKIKFISCDVGNMLKICDLSGIDSLKYSALYFNNYNIQVIYLVFYLLLLPLIVTIITILLINKYKLTLLKQRILGYCYSALSALIAYTLIIILFTEPSNELSIKLESIILAFPITMPLLFLMSILLSYLLEYFENIYIRKNNMFLLYFVRMLFYLIILPTYVSTLQPVADWFFILIDFRGFG